MGERWFEIGLWGGTPVVTAYAMGALYEGVKASLDEMKRTYDGILIILRHFISKDKYTENHRYRVSVYATKIGEFLGLNRSVWKTCAAPRFFTTSASWTSAERFFSRRHA